MSNLHIEISQTKHAAFSLATYSNESLVTLIGPMRQVHIVIYCLASFEINRKWAKRVTDRDTNILILNSGPVHLRSYS